MGCPDLLMVNGVDGFGLRILIHVVDLGPVGSSLRILAGFVLLNSLPAFILSVFLDLAKVAYFAVLITVVFA